MSEASPLIAVLDASVLYAAPLRHLLVALAIAGAFQARWTHKIQDEWTRSLLRDRPDLDAQRRGHFDTARAEEAKHEAIRQKLLEDRGKNSERAGPAAQRNQDQAAQRQLAGGRTAAIGAAAGKGSPRETLAPGIHAARGPSSPRARALSSAAKPSSNSATSRPSAMKPRPARPAGARQTKRHRGSCRRVRYSWKNRQIR